MSFTKKFIKNIILYAMRSMQKRHCCIHMKSTWYFKSTDIKNMLLDTIKLNSNKNNQSLIWLCIEYSNYFSNCVSLVMILMISIRLMGKYKSLCLFCFFFVFFWIGRNTWALHAYVETNNWNFFYWCWLVVV